MKKVICILLLMLHLPLGGHAQMPPVEASFLYIEADQQQLPTYFGHCAYRLSCPELNLDYAFTFESGGMETVADVLEANSLIALAVAPFDEFVEKYRQEGRTVYEYPLALRDGEIRRLWQLSDQIAARGAHIKADFTEFGCAIETASTIEASVDGHLVYGPRLSEIATTKHNIAGTYSKRSNWIYLFLSVFASSDADRELAANRRLILPGDMTYVWEETVVRRSDGTCEPIFATRNPIVYAAATNDDTAGWIPSPIVVFGILLIWAIALSVLQCTKAGGRRIKSMARWTDFAMFTAIAVVGVMMAVLYATSDTTMLNGWNRSALVFNPLPLMVWLINLRRPFKERTQFWAYIVYTVIVACHLATFIICHELCDTSEYVIMAILIIRCATNAWTLSRETARSR
ncbi:MAG: DUF4105 domain-containing protein [Bacteroidaceae bacterium]|nr:DUF4105 domain-containing protein [Bacteroidaceae bacterium]MBQ9176439.1 DUF4105 domain-containing protein [Bacteroidaceae bacterium]